MTIKAQSNNTEKAYEQSKPIISDFIFSKSEIDYRKAEWYKNLIKVDKEIYNRTLSLRRIWNYLETKEDKLCFVKIFGPMFDDKIKFSCNYDLKIKLSKSIPKIKRTKEKKIIITNCSLCGRDIAPREVQGYGSMHVCDECDEYVEYFVYSDDTNLD